MPAVVSPERQALNELHQKMCRDAFNLMQGKNQDYAKDTDPFRNFRQFGEFGIIVRLGDKLARLQSFIENGTLAVKTESVEDTLLDVINYAVLFAGYITLGQANPVPAPQEEVAVDERKASPYLKGYDHLK